MIHKKRIFIVSGLLVVLGFALGIYSYQNQKKDALTRQAQEPNSALNRPHSPTYGPSTAKVRIVEFFDPVCETCRAFYPLVKRLVDEQQGKVQLAVRYLPLHQGSESAVKILEAARLQNVFWPVVEATLQAQPLWAAHHNPNPEHIWEFLGKTGLDIAQAKQDVNLPTVQAAVNQDIADALSLKVTKTPGFFVNGRPLQDFGYEQLKALVAEEVQRAYAQ